jgi:hypothetical protein
MVDFNVKIDVPVLTVFVDGVVQAARTYLDPVLAAKGEAAAALIHTRSKYEVRKLENQLAIIEKTDKLLQERGGISNPIHEDSFSNAIEGAGKASDEKVRQMWAELLVKAVTTNGFETRLQTFSNVLAQLSPGDAAFLNVLVGMIPNATAIRLTSYFLRYEGKQENGFQKIECHYSLRERPETTLNEYLLNTHAEFLDAIFSLNNLHRMGLIVKSQSLPLQLLLDTDQFTFTFFGQWFINSVGLLNGRDAEFEDMEILDKMFPVPGR